MLVAREYMDYENLSPGYDHRRPQVVRVRRIGMKTKFVYCLVVVIALALAFLVTSRHAQIASTGYDILALRKQVQALETENQALANRIDELKSLPNIERIATTRLGMQKPELAEGVQFVPVEYSEAKYNPGVASTGREQKPPAEQKRNFLVQALARIING